MAKQYLQVSFKLTFEGDSIEVEAIQCGTYDGKEPNSKQLGKFKNFVERKIDWIEPEHFRHESVHISKAQHG